MVRSLRKYIAYFRMRFIAGMQYRAAALAGITTQFAWGMMEVLLFFAFYKSNAAAFPMDFSALVSYLWMQQAFLTLFMPWVIDTEILTHITKGNIAYELVRPCDIYTMWFVKNAAMRLSRAVLRCFPILFIAALLPEPFRLSLPTSPLSASVFIVTAILAMLTVTSFCMFVYILTFYTMNPSGIRQIVLGLSELLTGAIVPLPFMPAPVRNIIALTPFAAMQNLPLRIYSGDLAGTEAAVAVSLQIFWLIAMTAGGWLWMRRALNRVVIQGG